MHVRNANRYKHLWKVVVGAAIPQMSMVQMRYEH